jgi:hypothetical protein
LRGGIASVGVSIGTSYPVGIVVDVPIVLGTIVAIFFKKAETTVINGYFANPFF